MKALLWSASPGEYVLQPLPLNPWWQTRITMGPVAMLGFVWSWGLRKDSHPHPVLTNIKDILCGKPWMGRTSGVHHGLKLCAKVPPWPGLDFFLCNGGMCSDPPRLVQAILFRLQQNKGSQKMKCLGIGQAREMKNASFTRPYRIHEHMPFSSSS